MSITGNVRSITMKQVVNDLRFRQEIGKGIVSGEWWHDEPDGRIICDLCPRRCSLRDGQHGFCVVRQARDGEVVLTSYGRSSGLCIDPIEKKPLHHFYPGSSVLSFGTAGCNLGCRFCQNWTISKARAVERASKRAMPDDIAEAAERTGCQSIAFTYNDPVIFAEYVIDTAIAAHERDIKTVAVSAGYITPEARPGFFKHIDAANIDLKGFTIDFYRRYCLAERDPVLDTLRWIRHETDVWLEVTTLLIPGHNDSPEEIEQLCHWFVENLGPDVPLHFTAFHPDFKMQDVPPTPASTLLRARQQARDAGLHFVYTGNIPTIEGQSTECLGCGTVLIERQGYHLLGWKLDDSGQCSACGTPLPGHFGRETGHRKRWRFFT